MCHGNVFLRQAEIFQPLEDPTTVRSRDRRGVGGGRVVAMCSSGRLRYFSHWKTQVEEERVRSCSLKDLTVSRKDLPLTVRLPFFRHTVLIYQLGRHNLSGDTPRVPPSPRCLMKKYYGLLISVCLKTI